MHIQSSLTEQELIKQCREEKRSAQKLLYDSYSPKMFGICKRYLKSREDAEDALISGFYKVFSKLSQYKGNGSFEGWIRRIIVNECLMFLRKKHNFNMTVEFSQIEIKTEVNAEDALREKDIMKLLELLPTGYRTVFNLYEIEGYKHKEIGELMGISINTSKSQLILAKKRLRKILTQSSYTEVG